MENISLLSWNIRGFNNGTAKRNLAELVKKCDPTIIFLQETKCAEIDDLGKERI